MTSPDHDYVEEAKSLYTIRDWQEEVGRWSRAKGWHDKEVPVPESLMLMVSETTEALEHLRDGLGPNEVFRSPGEPEHIPMDPVGMVVSQSSKPDGIPIEIADLVIRCLDFADRHGFDLQEMIRAKMQYNWTRPYRHGRKL